MIRKRNIHKNIDELEKLFEQSAKRSQMQFYSKLAILELCGWIEVVMDDILLECMSKHIHDDKNLKIAKEAIKRHSSFNYAKFKDVLIVLIGMKDVEKIEFKMLPSGKLDILKSKLGTLTKRRNELAHTHSQKQQFNDPNILCSPNVTKNEFNKIFDGLKAFEKELKRIR